MSPEDVPEGRLLLDTDVVSWIALGEARAGEFLNLIAGHRAFISFVTLAETQTLLQMKVLEQERAATLQQAVGDYALLPMRVHDVVSRWAELRAATAQVGGADDRERRQNDTWIAACALSVDPPLLVVTGNLRDFQVLAGASQQLQLVHPDL